MSNSDSSGCAKKLILMKHGVSHYVPFFAVRIPGKRNHHLKKTQKKTTKIKQQNKTTHKS